MIRFFRRKTTEDPAEREKIAKLERAEAELQELKVRGERAVRLLNERSRRNHWRESVEQMIQGAP